MNEPSALTHVAQIILARTLVAGEKGATVSELRKAIEPLAGHRWAGSALGERIDRALVELASAGFLQRPLLIKKSERVTITQPGRAAILAALGLDQLPPKTTWDKLKKTYLSALALGLPSPHGPALKSFGGEPGFKATLLKAEYDLPLSDFPTIDQAIDALAWKLLGFPAGRKFDLISVKTALIRRELGDSKELETKPDPKKEAAKLLAKTLGARQTGKDELRLSALRRWVDGEAGIAAAEPEPEPEPTTSPPSIPCAVESNSFREGEAPAEPQSEFGSAGASPSRLKSFTIDRAEYNDDLSAFAARVLEAAKSSPTGHFGANKVFISHVWRLLRDDPAVSTMSLDEFKKRLAEANQARLLDLSRADLVEAMDPEDVRLSEVSHLGASFHFIRV